MALRDLISASRVCHRPWGMPRPSARRSRGFTTHQRPPSHRPAELFQDKAPACLPSSMACSAVIESPPGLPFIWGHNGSSQLTQASPSSWVQSWLLCQGAEKEASKSPTPASRGLWLTEPLLEILKSLMNLRRHPRRGSPCPISRAPGCVHCLRCLVPAL